MSNFVFIGYMFSGKSTIGKALANELSYEFIDTDQVISEETDLTIAEIFEKKGEAYFRELETKTIKNLSKNLQNTILSTGGGLSVREENIKYLKEIGTIIYLKVSKETVLERLNKDIERPLLAEENPEDKIDKMLKVRSPIYEQVADFTIDTDNKSVERITNEIKTLLSLWR